MCGMMHNANLLHLLEGHTPILKSNDKKWIRNDAMNIDAFVLCINWIIDDNTDEIEFPKFDAKVQDVITPM